VKICETGNTKTVKRNRLKGVFRKVPYFNLRAEWSGNAEQGNRSQKVTSHIPIMTTFRTQ